MLERGLVLIGCGKMGSAMLKGWLAQGLAASRFWVQTPHPEPWLAEAGVHVNAPLPPNPDVIVLAVKPQKMDEVLPDLAAQITGAAPLIMSIAAGTRLARLAQSFGPQARLMRAMPNTPAAIGCGITAIVGNEAATGADYALTETLLRAVGDVVRLDDEAQMDAVTAVSGSGPAYVFHMIEALSVAAIAQGLSPDLAMRLARATVTGAGALSGQSHETAAKLRENVTSPGGTTAAGLGVLMAELPDLMRKTVAAAAARGRELGAK